MHTALRLRFYVTAAIATASAIAAIITLLAGDWIEVAFGVNPDQSSGSLELVIDPTLLCAMVAAAGIARHDWRQRIAVASR